MLSFPQILYIYDIIFLSFITIPTQDILTLSIFSDNSIQQQRLTTPVFSLILSYHSFFPAIDGSSHSCSVILVFLSNFRLQCLSVFFNNISASSCAVISSTSYSVKTHFLTLVRFCGIKFLIAFQTIYRKYYTRKIYKSRSIIAEKFQIFLKFCNRIFLQQITSG